MMPDTTNTGRNRLTARIAFAAAATAVTALALLPQTGWLVREQLRGRVSGVERLRDAYDFTSIQTAPPDSALRRAADRHPNDLQLQIALAAQTPGASEKVSRFEQATTMLWNNRERFQNNPAFHATYLRYAFGASPRLGRDVEQEYAGSKSRADAEKSVSKRGEFKATRWQSDPAFTSRALTIARAGERLDPDNAVFPFEQAAILLAVQRDGEAFAALTRAARCSHWQEYVAVEGRGRLRLSEAASGLQGTLNRISGTGAILFPQYASLRGTARLLASGAITREEAGDTSGGLRIRHSLSRVAALMRSDSTTNIGSLVGMAMASIAQSKPGGEYLASLPGEDGTHYAERRAARYLAYLNRTGQGDEARWVQQERKQRDAARLIIQNADIGWFSAVTQGRLMLAWGAGILLLVNSLWLLLGGGLAHLIYRRQNHREAAPLSLPTRYAFTTLAATPIALMFAASVLTMSGLTGIIGGTLILLAGIAALTAPVVLLWRDPTGRGQELSQAARRTQFRRGMTVYLTALATTVAVCAFVAAIVNCLLQSPQAAFATLDSMNGAVGAFGEGEMPTHHGPLLLVTLLSLAAPLLVATIGAVRSGRQSVPLNVGLTRAFRQAALPVSTILLMVYCVVAFLTITVEHRLWSEIDESITHEGRYMARLQGTLWPGAVPSAEGDSPNFTF